MKLPLMFLLAACATGVVAQGLPPATRTVYKCEEEGKTLYSDTPCLGAKKVDVEPTRGLNKTTGRERLGQDVTRERNNEVIAEAVRPLTGMNARQLEQAGRRQKLSPDAQRQCRIWDLQVPAAEAAERAAKTGAELAAAQQHLLALRTAYRKAGCD